MWKQAALIRYQPVWRGDLKRKIKLSFCKDERTPNTEQEPDSQCAERHDSYYTAPAIAWHQTHFPSFQLI